MGGERGDDMNDLMRVPLSPVIHIRVKRVDAVGVPWEDIDPVVVKTFDREPEDIVKSFADIPDVYEVRWNWGPTPGGVLHGTGQGHYVPGPMRKERYGG
jgi:hypothetical protein